MAKRTANPDTFNNIVDTIKFYSTITSEEFDSETSSKIRQYIKSARQQEKNLKVMRDQSLKLAVYYCLTKIDRLAGLKVDLNRVYSDLGLAPNLKTKCIKLFGDNFKDLSKILPTTDTTDPVANFTEVVVNEASKLISKRFTDEYRIHEAILKDTVDSLLKHSVQIQNTRIDIVASVVYIFYCLDLGLEVDIKEHCKEHNLNKSVIIGKVTTLREAAKKISSGI